MIHEIELLNELTAVPMGNAKLRWLEEHKSDEGLQKALKFLFDTNIATGVSTKKLKKSVEPQKGIDTFDDLISYFETHKSGRDVDIAMLNGYLEDKDPIEQEGVRKFVSKQWNDLGIGEPSLKKIFGDGFVPKFKVQLAAKWADVPEWVNGKEFTLTIKFDGIRVILVKRDEDISMWTRTGKAMEGFETVLEDLASAPGSFVIDGELLPKGWQGMSNKDQYKAAISGKSGKVKDKSTLVLGAFDYLEIAEWDSKTCTTPYSKRREKLESIAGQFQFIDVVPSLYVGSDQTVISQIHKDIVGKGYEGIMLNINDAQYQFSRTKDLLKVKEFSDQALRIVGFEQGTGKNKNRLGALVCAYRDDEFPGNTVRVGGGYKDEDRDWIWNNQENLIGRYVDVSFFEETTSGGIPSLRFPQFLRLREEDYSPSDEADDIGAREKGETTKGLTNIDEPEAESTIASTGLQIKSSEGQLDALPETPKGSIIETPIIELPKPLDTPMSTELSTPDKFSDAPKKLTRTDVDRAELLRDESPKSGVVKVVYSGGRLRVQPENEPDKFVQFPTSLRTKPGVRYFVDELVDTGRGFYRAKGIHALNEGIKRFIHVKESFEDLNDEFERDWNEMKDVCPCCGDKVICEDEFDTLSAGEMVDYDREEKLGFTPEDIFVVLLENGELLRTKRENVMVRKGRTN